MGDHNATHQLVVEHYYLVQEVARSLIRRLPSYIRFEDLTGEGLVGLVKAAQRYEEDGGDFRAYARALIKGHVLDALRRDDKVPRRARAVLRIKNNARRELEQKLGREPTEAELQENLNLSEAEQKQAQRWSTPILVLSLDYQPETGDGQAASLADTIPDPNSEFRPSLEKDDLLNVIVGLASALSPKTRQMFNLYYLEGMKAKDIALIHKCTESNVCCHLKSAVACLRKLLSQLDVGLLINRHA